MHRLFARPTHADREAVDIPRDAGRRDSPAAILAEESGQTNGKFEELQTVAT